MEEDLGLAPDFTPEELSALARLPGIAARLFRATGFRDQVSTVAWQVNEGPESLALLKVAIYLGSPFVPALIADAAAKGTIDASRAWLYATDCLYQPHQKAHLRGLAYFLLDKTPMSACEQEVLEFVRVCALNDPDMAVEIVRDFGNFDSEQYDLPRCFEVLIGSIFDRGDQDVRRAFDALQMLRIAEATWPTARQAIARIAKKQIMAHRTQLATQIVQTREETRALAETDDLPATLATLVNGRQIRFALELFRESPHSPEQWATIIGEQHYNSTKGVFPEGVAFVAFAITSLPDEDWTQVFEFLPPMIGTDAALDLDRTRTECFRILTALDAAKRDGVAIDPIRVRGRILELLTTAYPGGLLTPSLELPSPFETSAVA